MTHQPKALKWNPKQLKILELLNSGLGSNQTAKQVGVSISTVVKVHNAIKKGQSPATPYVPKAKQTAAQKIQSATIKVADEAVAAAAKAAEVKKQADAIATGEEKKEEPAKTAPPTGLDTATEAKLVSYPTIIPLTPLMVSVKAYLVQVKHWSVDTKWQDIIDTIFYNYFKSLNPPVIFQGWYIGEPGKESNSPKPAREEDKGDGHKQVSIPIGSPEFKQLADLVTMQILDMAQKGQLGG